MDLFKELGLIPIQSRPDVWVSRLVIIKQITPKPDIIRNIHLNCGLNIIWAKETEEDSPTADITGHSAGKTTFCRLFRYVLGERTFGTKATMELIRKAFPDGYVAAEIHIHGRKWSIRRPFGSGRMSYIKEDSSIEDLLERGGRSVTQESYILELSLNTFLSNLKAKEIVQTGEPIQWAHILSWCTRDQETRFQNIHDWRSPRSEAEAPSFRFPKAGPLFVMRSILGLFLSDELKDEERLAELQRKKDKLTKEIEDKRREPQFRINLYDSRVRGTIKKILSDEPDVDSRPIRSNDMFLDDLDRLTIRARKVIGEAIEKSEHNIIDLQAIIDNLGADIKGENKELDQFEAIFGLDTKASKELDEASRREKERKSIEELKNSRCTLGDVLISQCQHIQSHLHDLKITGYQDALAMKLAEKRRAEECQRIEGQKNQLKNTIALMEEERQKAFKQRETLLAQLRDQYKVIDDLNNYWDELISWMQKRDKSGVNKELDLLHKKLITIENDIIKVENELAEHLIQHEENRKLLGLIFSGIVRSVLSSGNYDGEVGLENRELSFQIIHGSTMSGEAIETLSVLLSDICCLVFKTVNKLVNLPGILIHDSPREADLGLRIYYSFIRLIADIQKHFGSSDSCPFQYIITTTTPPPKELDSDQFVKLRLNAARAEELLFKANIATPHQREAFQ